MHSNYYIEAHGCLDPTKRNALLTKLVDVDSVPTSKDLRKHRKYKGYELNREIASAA